MEQRILDWRSRHDPRSLNYPSTVTETGLRTQKWQCDKRLDQGEEGACVGFGVTHDVNCEPFPRSFGARAAFDLYDLAKTLDEWAGENYEGTSVLAGAKAALKRGWIKRYEWCFGIDSVAQTIAWRGPVVIGINWYEGMWDTDSSGFVYPTGKVVGGHCVCVRGLILGPYGNFFVVRNSWGRSWGINGDCYIWEADLARLLSQNGEACYLVE